MGLMIGSFNLNMQDKNYCHLFEVQSLKGFGIEDMNLFQIAAGAALHYLTATEK